MSGFFAAAALALALLMGAPRQAAAVCVCDPDMGWTERNEWTGPLASSSSVDVNLGNSPTAFVRAAYWQVNGAEPSAAFVTQQVGKLTGLSYWRRIDTVNTILNNAGSSKTRTFSDPWTSEPALTSSPCKTLGRDVGAVLMLFFDCPGGVNCGMTWANNHALGMDVAHSLLGFGASPTGFYKAINNAGMLQRELLDGRYAGLQFFLPNIYGWDINDGSVDNLVSALNAIAATSITAQVKVGMFDDTWGWGNGGRPAPWNTAPNMASTVAASDYIFNNKWAPYFDKVPSQYWYTVGGKPLIYFYNAGTLAYANSANVFARLKTLFNTRYGVQPFLVVDDFFWQDAGMSAVANGRFVWRPTSNLTNGNSTTYTYSGVTLSHSMPRWDPIGRDSNGATSVVATAGDGVIKGPEYLTNALSNSTASDLLVLATWNDLGEGTGLNRAYDYYYQGDWEPPTVFMDLIRASQSQQSCPPGSPTETPSFTASPTHSPTRTATPSFTATRTGTPTGSPSHSPSPTGTPSASPTESPTLSATPTISPSPTDGPSPTESQTPTSSPTPTLSSTPSASPTESPTLPPSPSSSVTPTETLSLTLSPTPTASPTGFSGPYNGLRVLQAVPLPNPQRGSQLRIRVQLTAPASTLQLRLYTQALVRTLTLELPGSYQIGWNELLFPGLDSLPAGLYFGRVGALGSVNDADSASPAFPLWWIK